MSNPVSKTLVPETRTVEETRRGRRKRGTPDTRPPRRSLLALTRRSGGRGHLLITPSCTPSVTVSDRVDTRVTETRFSSLSLKCGDSHRGTRPTLDLTDERRTEKGKGRKCRIGGRREKCSDGNGPPLLRGTPSTTTPPSFTSGSKRYDGSLRHTLDPTHTRDFGVETGSTRYPRGETRRTDRRGRRRSDLGTKGTSVRAPQGVV